jgi:hypothetical protein
MDDTSGTLILTGTNKQFFMAELKTKVTNQSPEEFLNSIEPEQKRIDALELLKLFEKVTGEKPVMWGTSIIGFGTYHYKSEKSKQEGDWFLVGFSPRKQNLTLYVLHGNDKNPELLSKLGKHKTSGGSIGGCLYINKLADIDQKILAMLIGNSFHSPRIYST